MTLQGKNIFIVLFRFRLLFGAVLLFFGCGLGGRVALVPSIEKQEVGRDDFS